MAPFKFLLFLLSLHLCTQALNADPHKQANEALALSATRAREASDYVSRLSSGKSPSARSSHAANAFKDCTAMMSHSTNRLVLSVKEMKHLGTTKSPDHTLHLSNVQTWVSSALTDQDMCLDSLSRFGSSSGSGGGSGTVEEVVRRKVVSVRVVTSRALALVNRMS